MLAENLNNLAAYPNVLAGCPNILAAFLNITVKCYVSKLLFLYIETALGTFVSNTCYFCFNSLDFNFPILQEESFSSIFRGAL